MTLPLEAQVLVRALAVTIPAGYVAAAALAPLRRSRRSGRADPLGPATGAAAAGILLAALVAIGALFIEESAGPSLGVRLDLVTCVMLVLVSIMTGVIVRYSRTYLDGEQGVARYARWLMVTVAAVAVLVMANNLAVVFLGWVGVSLGLHQLLVFYDRTAAIIAAHKKFIASRVADVCLLGGIICLQIDRGTLEIDRLHAWAASGPALSGTMITGTVFLALAALVKCAQLPLHGWLTQVMEAPTPVSALLHAGIVNIGGFLMIRLAPVMALSDAGQWTLIVVGLATTIIAALIMTTRVSIKVALAWSTAAQMGMMLVQCGLGAWHLALLHLLAHSLYKAHAFLSSGSAVMEWRIGALSPKRAPLDLGGTVMVAGALLGVVAGVLFALGHLDVQESAVAVVLALALAPALHRGLRDGHAGMAAAQVGLVAGLYFTWHVLAGRVMHVEGPPRDAAWILVAAAFAMLFLVQAQVAAKPEGRLARALHPWLFWGLYLDERFTRLTFQLWPARLASGQGPDDVEPSAALEV